ncbi:MULTISPECIES: hypothetical protein [unclassified Mesorhizobium]|uniref:hypothetical protein n=1 Tax=unclassified Mesorhizobium TaxID=325217 RepID=UPI001129DDA9|nr:MULTISPECIES: hypothetical protein [unclassified Mesorhizobium]TPI56164.1 hypothetical protein FJW11_00505 [Mesorhizobium sp. B3-1-1]TPJ70514.1 hypothetical protein FJ462_07435 [Mesorhizobium sp. B2-6-7]TPJ89293.1 hypothetical protein FJ422_05375 [Mesorhizobium sp. B2-6-3]TPK04374.1 hypothetical protein FJ491_05375 [Mesorhizobium sp. B2-5-10]TPK14814.1 hypothetical protein FJ490_05770 [Mesorhizobium sp. B2-5-11]
MTILIPLIGTVIIFNQNFHSVFQFSTKFIRDIGGDAGSTSNGTGFYANNIYFLYFGLCSLGFGSFIFNVLCPSAVKNEPNIDAYLSATNLRENSVVAKSNLQFVLNAYCDHVGYFDEKSTSLNPEYPPEVEEDFSQLIHEMFDATMNLPEQKEWAGVRETNADPSETENEFLLSMYTSSGYPNINQIAYNVWSSPKAIWAFTMPFKNLSSVHAKDIAFVLYKTLNYSRFRARLYVFMLYTIGFSLLLIPTMVTFVRLAWHSLMSMSGYVY